MALLSHPARADTHCYGFRNDSAEVATLSFSYHPSIGNVITGAAIDPGKTGNVGSSEQARGVLGPIDEIEAHTRAK